jgi:hypothetical protein
VGVLLFWGGGFGDFGDTHPVILPSTVRLANCPCHDLISVRGGRGAFVVLGGKGVGDWGARWMRWGDGDGRFGGGGKGGLMLGKQI